MSRLDVTKAEREIIREDLKVCEAAYEVLRTHVQHRLNGPKDEQLFLSWSGSSATTGTLEMAIQHLRDLLERYDEAIERLTPREGGTVHHLGRQ